MAHKRMFSKDITESDAFADMPLSTQALYFHLGMNADDDGFINNPRKTQRSVGASTDDLNLLIAKKFIIPFESGVVVVKHWRINNTVRSDRYTATNYQDEMAQLELEENKAYKLKNDASELVVSQLDTVGIPDGNQMDTQKRIGKDRIEEDRKGIMSGKPDHADEIAEIVEYLNSKLGTSYKPKSKDTASKIGARLDEGFTVSDFKAVIDSKVSQWGHDPKMKEYLRPSTLFAASKFEGYLQNARVKEVKADERWAKYR